MFRKIMLFLLIGLTQCAVAGTSSSFFSKINPKSAAIVLQAGGFRTSQGESQNINIDGLIGDRFTVNNHYENNALLGLGYYIHGLDAKRVSLLFGVNAFYLAHTAVDGDVIQEQLFTNLSYHYSITNYPIYAAAKVFIKNDNDHYNLTFDVGIGPNIIHTSDFSESSLDGGMTLPDKAFSGQTTTAFSATAGIGFKINHLIGNLPCELSYRFFYLGPSNLKIRNDEILNSLHTGSNYANALIFSVYV